MTAILLTKFQTQAGSIASQIGNLALSAKHKAQPTPPPLTVERQIQKLSNQRHDHSGLFICETCPEPTSTSHSHELRQRIASSGKRVPFTSHSAYVENVKAEGRISITQINEECRLLVVEPASDNTSFSVRLQNRINDQWHSLASYDARKGKALRTMFSVWSAGKSQTMDLPLSVVKEMALFELKENWAKYKHSYLQEGMYQAMTSLFRP